MRDEGGDRAATIAAANIVTSQVKMMHKNMLLANKFPWFKMNTMSRRVEFMHLESHFSDMYAEAWKTTTNSTVVDRPVIQAAAGLELAFTPEKAGRIVSVGNPGPELADTPKPGKGGRAGKGNKRKTEDPEPHVETPEQAEVKRQKKAEGLELQKVGKVKSALTKTTAEAYDLLDTIGSTDSWSWANNEFLLKELKTAFSHTQTLNTWLP